MPKDGMKPHLSGRNCFVSYTLDRKETRFVLDYAAYIERFFCISECLNDILFDQVILRKQQQIKNYGYEDANWKDKLTSYNGQTITYDEIDTPSTVFCVRIPSTLYW